MVGWGSRHICRARCRRHSATSQLQHTHSWLQLRACPRRAAPLRRCTSAGAPGWLKSGCRAAPPSGAALNMDLRSWWAFRLSVRVVSTSLNSWAAEGGECDTPKSQRRTRCLAHPLLHCQQCVQSVWPPTAPAPHTCVASLSRLRRLSTTVCEWSADCLLGPPPENVCRSEIAWLSACGGGSTKGCGQVRARHAQRPRQWPVRQQRPTAGRVSSSQPPSTTAAHLSPAPGCPA